MLRDGPIPRFVHGILEYALGVLFIAAPFLFDFDSGAATGMSVAVGVLILILAAASEGPVSLVDQLPLILHVALLYLLAIFLIAAPFILGFSEEVPPRNFFIISGVLLLLITIGTRFRRSDPSDGAEELAGRPAGRTNRGSTGPGPTGPGPTGAGPTGPGPSIPPPGSMPPSSGSIPAVPPQPPLRPQERGQQARHGYGAQPPGGGPGTGPNP